MEILKVLLISDNTIRIANDITIDVAAGYTHIDKLRIDELRTALNNDGITNLENVTIWGLQSGPCQLGNLMSWPQPPQPPPM